LLATVKVHSSLKKYFNQQELRADFNTYYDVVPYLKAMHPKFGHYMDMVNWGETEESYTLLDKDLNLVTQEQLHIKRVNEDDIIHLVPVIVGGGGKKGGLLAILAIGAFAFASGGLSVAAAGAGGGATAGAGAAATSGATGFQGIFQAFQSMPSFAQSLFMNIGLSVISSIFTKKKKNVEVDNSTREGGMFGSLTNSTESGTPIALHYGYVRVAGQMLSGYIESDDHGKNDVIAVRDKF
jgi:predicted phage tail protein